MTDTHADDAVDAAKETELQAGAIASTTVDGQSVTLRDPSKVLSAAQRRANRQNGRNPSTARIDLSGF
jgi:hypothetical protein